MTNFFIFGGLNWFLLCAVSGEETSGCSSPTGLGATPQAKAWFKELNGLKANLTDKTNSQISYNLGICIKPLDIAKEGVGIMQTTIEGTKTSSVSIGSWKNAKIAASGNKWMTIILDDGDMVQHCVNDTKQAILLVACDKDLKDGETKLSLVTGSSPQTQKFVFTLAVAKGCLIHTATAPASSGPSTLGSFFFVLFLLLVTYFIVGFLYKRFVLGARGFEQMPNYLFFLRIGRTIQDKFSAATNAGQTGSPTDTRNSAYRGGYRQAPGDNEFRYDNPPLMVDSSIESEGTTLGSDQYRPNQLKATGLGGAGGTNQTKTEQDDADERLLEV